MLRHHSRLRGRASAVLAFALLTLFTTAASATAATNTWTGATDTSWIVGTNWSDGVPTSDDDVVIPDDAYITSVPNPTIHGLELGSDATLQGTSLNRLTVTSGDASFEGGGTWTDLQLTLDGSRLLGTSGSNNIGIITTIHGQVRVASSTTFTDIVIMDPGASFALDVSEPTLALNQTSIGSIAVTGTGQLALNNGTFDAIETASDVSTTLGDTGAVTVTGATDGETPSVFNGSVAFLDNTVELNADATTFAAEVSMATTGTTNIGAGASFTNPAATVSVTNGTLSVATPINEFEHELHVDGGTFAVTGSGASTFASDVRIETGNATFAGAATFAADNQVLIEGGSSQFSGTSVFNGSVEIAGGNPEFTDAMFNGYTEFGTAASGAAINFGATSTGFLRAAVTAAGMSGITVANAGNLTIEGAATITGLSTAVTNSGRLEINKPLTVSGMSAGSLTNSGTLSLDPGAGNAVVIGQGVGPITGGAFTNTGNTYLVTGTLESGSFTQSAAGQLFPTLISAGNTAGTNFTQLKLRGEARLGGTLRTSVKNGFPQPAANASFPVITSATLHPTDKAFASTEGAGFDNGVYVSADAPTASGVNLTVKQATVTLTATTVNPGGSFAISGSGFQPGENVIVNLGVSYGQSGDTIGEVVLVASASGTISGALPAPATAKVSAPGNTYSVVVIGDLSRAFLSVPVSIVAAVITGGDTDGDGLPDSRDCNPTDKSKPAQGTGVVDTDCNGVNDMIQPFKFIGTKKNDKVVTFNGNDTITTGAGNDSVKSGGGNDKIDAGLGNDVVDAGAGNDTVAGGAGNDKLTGGTGKDKLNGGPGNDTINAKDKSNGDTIICGAGKDTVIADKKDKVGKDCEKVKRS